MLDAVVDLPDVQIASRHPDPRRYLAACAGHIERRLSVAFTVPVPVRRPANPPVASAWPSLTVLPWPAVGGERGGGAGQEEGGGEYDGGNPEAVQDADAVAEETNHWRPGEEGHVAD
jgi:hypothetical protein